MDNYEMDNDSMEIDTTEDGVDKEKVILGAFATGGICASLFLLFKNYRLKKKLKKALENNADFQMVIRKHQAEIDILTNEKERQEYLICLYKEYISKMEK